MQQYHVGVANCDPREFGKFGNVFFWLKTVIRGRGAKGKDRSYSYKVTVRGDGMCKFVLANLKKGDKVLVAGILDPDPKTGGPRLWVDNDGNTRANYDLIAQSIELMSGSYTSHEDDGTDVAHSNVGLSDHWSFDLGNRNQFENYLAKNGISPYTMFQKLGLTGWNDEGILEYESGNSFLAKYRSMSSLSGD